MSYLVDTNIFVEAQNRYYGMDFCPAFWELLEKYNQDDLVFSIDKVKDELLVYDDEISDWAKEHSSFFHDIMEETLEKVTIIAEWVNDKSNYSYSAKDSFFNCADLFLVAHAMAFDLTVVTHEVSAPNSKNRIKIPDVCIAHDIKYINTFDMLRMLNARFILG